MALWLDVAQVASVLNVALLAGLGVVWLRNYRLLHSKHALGLLVFGGFLLAENLLWVYTYFLTPHGWMYAGGTPAMQAMMGLCVLETFGLATLAWVTWD